MSYPVDPVGAWSELGAGRPLHLDGMDLFEVGLAFRHPVRTARGEHRSRPLLLVRIRASDPDGPVEGWGECAALGDTTYDAEDVSTAWVTLQTRLLPALVAAAGASRLVPPLWRLAMLRPQVAPAAPLAFAALEMAVADAHLRATSTSLAELVGAVSGPIPTGAVVGQFSASAELVDHVEGLVREGFTRVKLKVAPGADLEPVSALRTSFPDLGLQVDANESYEESDTSRLARLDDLALLCIEQPFPREQFAAHARLAARIRTPVCLDESLTSPAAVVAALDSGACSVVCVKPARLGGIGAALQTVTGCEETGVPMWIGGMFESGFARQVNAAVASMAGFSWPGDLSPARRYLDEDLVAGPSGPPCSVRASREPGVSPAPDSLTVERLAVRSLHVVLAPGQPVPGL